MILLLISSRPIPRVDLSCGEKEGEGGDWGVEGVTRLAELGRRGEAEAKKNERRRTLRLRGGNAESQGSVAQGESLSEEQGDALTYLNVSSRETKTTPVNPRNRCAAVPLHHPITFHPLFHPHRHFGQNRGREKGNKKT